MGRWSDIATWRGPTPNQTPGTREQRGVVIHIAEGTFEGTISWCRNTNSSVSAHFVVARDGRIAQLVDTDNAAWTQRSGNGRWLSIENEGYTPGALTAAQVVANARILARAHQVYGVPLQIATSPSGRGLGHHSMGADWGHQDCPGPAIIAQKPTIVASAVALAGGQTTGDDMEPLDQLFLRQIREMLSGMLAGADPVVRPQNLTGATEPVPNTVARRLTALEAKPPAVLSEDDRAAVVAALRAEIGAVVAEQLAAPEFAAVLREAARAGAELAEDS